MLSKMCDGIHCIMDIPTYPCGIKVKSWFEKGLKFVEAHNKEIVKAHVISSRACGVVSERNLNITGSQKLSAMKGNYPFNLAIFIYMLMLFLLCCLMVLLIVRNEFVYLFEQNDPGLFTVTNVISWHLTTKLNKYCGLIGGMNCMHDIISIWLRCDHVTLTKVVPSHTCGTCVINHMTYLS